MAHGRNGHPDYEDSAAFPMPAIRFKEHTADNQALREKEKGDWGDLTIDEKKECESKDHMKQGILFIAQDAMIVSMKQLKVQALSRWMTSMS